LQRNQSSGSAKTAGEDFKNIQVLKNVPVTQFGMTMTYMESSLGVGCGFCHAAEFDKETPIKIKAREMLVMMNDLNARSFRELKSAITCYTCHQGKPRPVAIPEFREESKQPSASAAALPSADEIMDRYVRALGGASRIESLRTRLIEGSQINDTGFAVKYRAYQEFPDKELLEIDYPRVTVFVGYNGVLGWARTSAGRDPMDEELLRLVKFDAEFYPGIKLKKEYTNLKVTGEAPVRDRLAYVIAGTSPDGSLHRLFFDTQTGLLIRREREFETALGLLVNRTELEDYKEVDGVKIPHTVRWLYPGSTLIHKVTRIQHGVPIGADRFSAPAGAN
jgi:hypothetical protein